MDAGVIGNNPYLFEHTFTLPNTLTGLQVRYKLEATNERAATLSNDFLTATLAGIAPAPTTGPVDTTTVTNDKQIGVTVTAVTDNGGSTIISYNL